MRSIRLLPVVIFAALALLVFKGIGLVTNGGYVLTGPVAAIAQEGDDPAAAASDVVGADTSPVVTDTAPTLAATKSDAPSSSASSLPPASSLAAAPSSSDVSMAAPSSTVAEPPSPSSAEAPASKAEVCPDTGPSSAPASASGGDLNDKIGNALANGCPSAPTPVNANGDVLPTTKDGNGHIVPLETAEGDNSEDAILQRLAERRAELDKRESDLQMREALVDAAEKKLDERTKALQDLETQVNALVDQKQAEEDAGFKAVVSMYETMKPKDAAAIFDTLDINVLLKIARAMNPRKMAPVLAAMSAQPAELLTTALASTNPVNTVADNAAGNTAALPQIVGH